MIGRRQALVVGLVVVLALVALGAFVYLNRARPPAPAPAPPPAATSAWYELYFTTPVYPDSPSRRQGGIDEKMVALIDTAKVTIDAAAYDFDLENVAQALARARARGVRVRFVTDTDTWTSKDDAIQRAWSIVKQAEIPVVEDSRGPIMHHKFMVVDGEWVWTGSWNWTVGDTYRLNNNAVKIRSKELAANYTAEFEKMFVQRRFGPTKPKGVPYPKLTIEGVPVENYFAAEDGVGARLVDRLSTASSSIDFLAFSFTHDRIGRAVVDRAKGGVKVRGVFETTGSQTQFSEYTPMRDAGLEVYLDGNPYVMHHKVFVLDRKTVVFGSFNFSSNADQDNDENVLIVDDPAMAQAFLAEVERIIAAAKNAPARKK
jgi:phosphatidylserine/phosphatidylglycerophosphate/cardiolipin synthase-like enzyme